MFLVSWVLEFWRYFELYKQISEKQCICITAFIIFPYDFNSNNNSEKNVALEKRKLVFEPRYPCKLLTPISEVWHAHGTIVVAMVVLPE